jgi:Tfp pilus assembly protein PilX
MALTFGGASVTMTPATASAWGIQQVPAAGATAAGASSAGGASGGNTWGNLGMGLAVGQAIGAVVGAFISSNATSYVLNKQAEINEINKGRAQLGYESALRAGESQIGKVTREAGAVKAKQRNSMAANGVSVGVGSSAEVLATTDANKELDVRTIQENAIANAWGYSTKATQYDMIANTQRMGAQYASDTAISSTIAKGLESVGSVADKWYYYNRGY